MNFVPKMDIFISTHMTTTQGYMVLLNTNYPIQLFIWAIILFSWKNLANYIQILFDTRNLYWQNNISL